MAHYQQAQDGAWPNNGLVCGQLEYSFQVEKNGALVNGGVATWTSLQRTGATLYDAPFMDVFVIDPVDLDNDIGYDNSTIPEYPYIVTVTVKLRDYTDVTLTPAPFTVEVKECKLTSFDISTPQTT